MRTLVLRGVRNNTGRYIATLVAIITGVAFFAATGLVSDRVVNSLEGDVDRQYGNVDLAVVLRDTSSDSSSGNPATDLTISGREADRIRGVAGVDGTAGVVTAPVAFPHRGDATAATGRLWIADKELNPLEIVKGRGPTQAGQIAVDQGLAEQEKLSVGERVKLATLAGVVDATVVGVTRFGDTDALDQGGTVSIPEATAFAWLNSGHVEYESLYLRGADPDALQREVRPLVPVGFKAQTGEQFRDDQRESIGSIGRVIKQALQGFALLALFVGGFVIYNTFSVIVAQRLRELAVLAAIGATPKQIKRSPRYEGILIGLIGSVLGVVAGVVLTLLLIGVLSLFGVDLPGSGLGLSGATLVQGVVLGTLITWASVTIPARRAARIEPIEALRVAAAEGAGMSRRRAIVTAVLCTLGVALLLAGGSAAVVGFGAVLLFVGVIVGGPFLALAGARVARAPMSRFGLEGRLAVDNTSRNPARTATTANALLIGVFLVTLFSVAGTSVKDFAVGEIKKLDSADFVVTSDGGSIDPKLRADFERIKGVDSVTPFRREAVTIDGKASRLSSGDLGAMQKVADLEVAAGSLDDLGPGTIAVIADPEGGTAKIGSRVKVTDNAGDAVRLRVVAQLKASPDSGQVGALVAKPTFDDLVGDTAPTVAFIDTAVGARADTEDAIKARADQRPDIKAVEGNALGRLIATTFDFMINAVNGLLVMSVIVALIGIINTLSLSILERRRELGLLRVVGMTDNRVQRMVRLESVVIAGLGTVAGLLLGLFGAWAALFSINRLTDASIDFSVPVLLLAVVLVLGVVLGLLASLIPARRSTRLDVLEAIQST